MSLSDVRKLIVAWWHENISPLFESVSTQKYMREVAIVALIVFLVVGSYWGYRMYVSHQESAAQIALAQGIQAYQEASRGGSIRWPQVELLLQSGYEQHQKSVLAAYFLVYKADVQIKLGKLPEAVATLTTALEQFPKDSPFLGIFQLKQALMRMDLSDKTEQDAGLAALRALAFDKDNKNNDAALYQLGLFYWSTNDREQAVTTWKELVTGTSFKEKLGQSPWAQLAQERLAAAGQEVAA